MSTSSLQPQARTARVALGMALAAWPLGLLACVPGGAG